MPLQETWCDISFEHTSPHLRGDDPVPMILTHQIAGRHETVCLRCHGKIEGNRVIKGNVFYFPLWDFPEAFRPDDYAVLFVGFLDQCAKLNDKVQSLYRRGLNNDTLVVWLAKMSSVCPGPQSLLARPIPIGDKICGVIQPREVWVPEHFEKFFPL